MQGDRLDLLGERFLREMRTTVKKLGDLYAAARVAARVAVALPLPHLYIFSMAGYFVRYSSLFSPPAIWKSSTCTAIMPTRVSSS